MPGELPQDFGDDVTWRKRWMPTPKWAAAFVVGAGGIATASVEAGQWTDTLTIMAITFGVERAVAYITPRKGS